MYKCSLILIAVLAFMELTALASPITYEITVNTSSISGTSGSLDFQLDPGADSQAADLQILDFTSNGALTGAPSLTGDASGALPGTVTLDNLTGYNDYFQDFTYGTSLSFEVSLYGSALSSPSGSYPSDSEFAFSMFSDSAGTIPVLTSDTTDGFAAVVDINHDSGNTSVTNFSSQTSVTPIPEPSTLFTLGTGLLALGGMTRKFFP